MDRYPQHDVILATPEGEIRVRSFCRPEEIRRARFDEGFGEDEHYRVLYRPEGLAQAAAAPGADVVLALAGDRVVGYGVLSRPKREDRWSGMDEVMEVAAIETSRRRRERGIAGAVLGLIARHPRIEDWAVVVVGYAWSWDLRGCGLDAAAYRRMMTRLFASCGFREYATNEANLCLKAENFFLTRIGANLPPAARQRFKWLCYGQSGG
jgi:acetoin utilization protein AcuA